jgi:hypothetical protein
MFDTVLHIVTVWIATSFSFGAAWVGWCTLCYGFAALRRKSPGSRRTPPESARGTSAALIVRRLNISPSSNH